MSASLNDRPNRVEVSGDAATVTAGAGVQGAQGEPGIIISATEPTETDVLWADTSAAGSMVVPAGGSTGQVLAKASASDYDSEWITPSSGGIPATIIDAAGDLIVGTAADTAARLAVGTNGYVLTADSAQTGGMKWAAAPIEGAAALGNSVKYFGVPGNFAIAGASSVSLAGLGNYAFYSPMVVTSPITITEAQIAVGATAASAGGLARLSCYTADGSWQPVALVADWGEVATTSSGDKTISSLSTVLAPGRYLLRVHVNSTATMPSLIFIVSVPPAGGWNRDLSTSGGVTYPRRSVTYAPAEASPSPWNEVSIIAGGNNLLTAAFRGLMQVRWT